MPPIGFPSRLFKLRVATLVLFPTRPGSSVEREAKAIIEYRIKDGHEAAIRSYVGSVVALIEQHELRQFFHNAGTLVPAPKSSMHQHGSLWVPQLIATVLCENGLGARVEPLLKRTNPVRKSGGVTRSDDRPTVEEHFASLEATQQLYPPTRITIIDDVVTIGRTLMGAAKRLREAYPNTEVQAFALARSVRHTSLDSLNQMIHPEVSTYSMNIDTEWITHDGSH